MYGSTFGDLEYSGGCGTIEPIVRDKSNVPPQVTVLVVDEVRASVSPPFQVHRLRLLMETGLIAFTDACFEFADVDPACLSKSAQVLAVCFSASLSSFLFPGKRSCVGTGVTILTRTPPAAASIKA